MKEKRMFAVIKMDKFGQSKNACTLVVKSAGRAQTWRWYPVSNKYWLELGGGGRETLNTSHIGLLALSFLRLPTVRVG